jgi:hypothetical protein
VTYLERIGRRLGLVRGAADDEVPESGSDGVTQLASQDEEALLPPAFDEQTDDTLPTIYLEEMSAPRATQLGVSS